MKQKCAIVMLMLLVVVGTIAKKDAQQQKHDQEKFHKKPLLAHWDGGSKSDHHAIKEVMKHAPHTVNHHEVKTQVDLGRDHKKRVQSSTAELKLQDLSLEDSVHHKVQSEKHSLALSGRTHKTVHNKQHQHSVPPNNKFGVRNDHSRANGSDKKEKKAAKKILMSKNKKYKRAKRLHKFIW